MADTSVPFFENPAFKKSFADVPIDANNNISTKEFIEACESLVVIFGTLPLCGAWCCGNARLSTNDAVARQTTSRPLPLPPSRATLAAT